MASTGEVACFGFNQHEALIKSLMSANFKLPLPKPDRRAAILVSVGPEKDKIDFIECMKVLERRFKVYTTGGTHKYYEEHGVETELVLKPDGQDDEGKKDAKQAIDLISNKQVDLVIAIPAGLTSESITSGYKMRRQAVDFGISLMTNTKLATAFVQAIEHVDIENLPVRHWDEYVDPATRADEGDYAIVLDPWQTPLHIAKHADAKVIKAADGRVAADLAI
jgi:carbamoyl-phosphate synthase large subunit